MMSTAREAPTFLLTPRQHRAWAERARRANRHDLAQHHEQLARAIERIERREAEHNADRVPPLSRAAQKSPALAGLSILEERRTNHICGTIHKWEASTAVALAM
jgi:hypothetical protein